ncbi:hypothetical protein [uncultured Ramlibacter sp.]|uniref:hypothetical protein n=1 Tax=uncultured Ramlibacter sp. TaxID=260755 RepID=UPI0026100A47|nr:hypothetical protein [uncultured Ramlibacter sp.]
MHAQAHDIFADDPDSNTAAAIDARHQDAHWSRFFHLESYARPGLDYEDYAAAYCVGYIGCVQYGGCFDDAEKSLVSNWVRLKGDSRLALHDALPAMRAAWDRVCDEQTEDHALPGRNPLAGLATQRSQEAARQSA